MNYVTSKDYKRLWNLVQEGKEIVCFLEGKTTYVTIALKRGGYSEVFSRGIPGISSRTLKSFVQQCESNSLEFLTPDEWIRIESDKDLPPNGDYCVLIWHKIKTMDMAHVDYFYKSPTGNGLKYYQVTGVTHWKPLPEPPRE